MRLVFLFAAFFLSSFAAEAQNLIPNPGFERFLMCPTGLGNLHRESQGWNTPTQGTTDVFHACSSEMGVPENFNGAQPPLEGEGYAGFYAYAPGNYREYLQVRIKQQLQEGREYSLSLSLNLSERSNFALAEFGVLLTEKEMAVATRKVLSKRLWYTQKGNSFHFLPIKVGYFLNDTDTWITLSHRFVAKGTERFLIFGNFNSDTDTRKQATGQNSNKGAYYYVDALHLEAVGAPPVPDESSFRVDSLYTLPALLFEFDDSGLSAVGKASLQDLSAFLQAEPQLDLELMGHTDALGQAGYNIRLSERRCQVVARYLQQQGVEGKRIQWTGYGATRPVAGNETAEERSRNRRVEFLLRTPRDSLRENGRN